MAVWNAYPQDYRAVEVTVVLSAVRAGESVSIIGLSGAGKSNLMGFLANRQNTGKPSFLLVDGNRVSPRTADGLLQYLIQLIDEQNAPAVPPSPLILERLLARRLAEAPGGLCLLFDRYDALAEDERCQVSDPLRALRDAFKYQLSYVLATRRPLSMEDELAELFYANTLWLGPLMKSDAIWSAGQYAQRRGVDWSTEQLERLAAVSWGYPSLLRACCEAFASGAALEVEALRAHPAVQRRVQEFWADSPTAEDLRRSGLKDHPLLSAAAPLVSAHSPDLTANEHRLLAYLQAHPNEVCAKDDLIRAVWTEDQVIDGLRDDSLAQLVRRLRQKIEADPANPQHMLTVPGRGYRYVP